MNDDLQKLPARIEKANFMPPWLWCWLFLYIVGFFHTPTHIGEELKFFTSQDPNLSGDVFQLSLNTAEFVPLLAVFAGIIIVFLPWLRAWWLKLRYNILSIEDSIRIAPDIEQLLMEIEAFIHAFAPEVSVTYAIGFVDRTQEEDSPRRDQGLRQWVPFLLRKCWRAFTSLCVVQLPPGPIIYATGYFRTAITVSNEELNTWRDSRKKAHEELLHELAHHYHGDAAIVGAGSLLEAVSKRWIWFILIFILYDIVYYIPYLQVLNIIDQTSHSYKYSFISYTFQNLLMYDVPALLLNLLLSIIWSVATFVMLIVAIWCAELNADRFARDNAHSTLMLEDNKQKKILREWIFANINHPPLKMRRWASRQKGIVGNSLLLFLFPISFFLYFFALIAQDAVYGISYLFLGNESMNDPLKQIDDIHRSSISFQSMLPFLLIVAVIILLWPKCAHIWEHLFRRRRYQGNRTRIITGVSYTSYMMSSVSIICFCIFGILLLAAPTTNTTSNISKSLTIATSTPGIPTDDLPLPQLKHNYYGILKNAVHSAPAQLTFYQIAQDHQGDINGNLTIAEPLAEKGTFSGTVTNDRRLKFMFTPERKAIDMSIQFSGTVREDGTLVGFYTIVQTMQVGSWEAATV